MDRKESEGLSRCIPLGDSWEPPVATFIGQMERRNECREVVWYAPKRLPSKRHGETRLIDAPTFRERNLETGYAFSG